MFQNDVEAISGHLGLNHSGSNHRGGAGGGSPDGHPGPPQPRRPPATLPRQDEAAPSEEASLPPSGYLLGEYNGRVSVLSPGTREPEMIFDIFVRTLPDPDQQLLRQGIEVETYEELTRLIEDYIS